MYHNFQIDSAEDLVKGFAIAIRDGNITMEDVHKLIDDCTDGDERLTQMVLEKTSIQLECLQLVATKIAASTI